MFYGVAYYPEHWPEENWTEDAKNIRECGMDGVRIGEFAWSRMEPKEGEFDFEWLDSSTIFPSGKYIRSHFFANPITGIGNDKVSNSFFALFT